MIQIQMPRQIRMQIQIDRQIQIHIELQLFLVWFSYLPIILVHFLSAQVKKSSSPEKMHKVISSETYLVDIFDFLILSADLEMAAVGC